MKRSRPEPDHINQPSDVTRGIPGGSKIVKGKTNSSQGTNSMHDRAINNDKPFLSDVPLHPFPLHRLSSIQQNASKVRQINQHTSINLDFEEIHHFRKASYLKQFRDQTNNFFKTQKNSKIL